jgi:phosphoglycerate dehydrogenase-like enzyme
VHALAAGLDTFLFPALVESPVLLTNSRGVFSQSLGEFAIAAMLFFAKELRRMVQAQSAGVWDQFDVEELRGRTVGIVGYGDIGRAVARRAKAFDMNVLALRRRPERSDADPYVDETLGVEHKLELMERSDYLVVSAPLTPTTRGMIGAAELAAMRPTAVVINIGRGPVIDEAALVRALETKTIRGAALDVFGVEPLPAGHPFYRLDNVLLSPHCADHTATWIDDAVELFVDNLDRFAAGKPLRNVVEDKRLGY